MHDIAREADARWIRATLPHGVLIDGTVRLSEVLLRAPDGEDEAFLLETRETMLPGARASALIARCMREHGDKASELAMGDREALLLQLRRLALGDRMECLLACPTAECGERMELELRVDEFLLPPYTDAARAYNGAHEYAGARYETTFRVPATADVDAVAATARADPQRAGHDLLRRCVQRVTCEGVACTVDDLPPGVVDAIGAAMAERDPQAELTLELACPACGTEFSAVFDSAGYLMQELDARADTLLREVHALALNYGWAERDILRMPRPRRSQYLALLAEASAAHARR